MSAQTSTCMFAPNLSIRSGSQRPRRFDRFTIYLCALLAIFGCTKHDPPVQIARDNLALLESVELSSDRGKKQKLDIGDRLLLLEDHGAILSVRSVWPEAEGTIPSASVMRSSQVIELLDLTIDGLERQLQPESGDRYATMSPLETGRGVYEHNYFGSTRSKLAFAYLSRAQYRFGDQMAEADDDREHAVANGAPERRIAYTGSYKDHLDGQFYLKANEWFRGLLTDYLRERDEGQANADDAAEQRLQADARQAEIKKTPADKNGFRIQTSDGVASAEFPARPLTIRDFIHEEYMVDCFTAEYYDEKAHAEYLLAFSDQPADFLQFSEDEKYDVLWKSMETDRETIDGVKVSKINVSGRSGRSYSYIDGHIDFGARLVIVGTRVYRVIASAPTGSSAAQEARIFLNSFEITSGAVK